MAADRKRGRPKGTGINDHEMLVKIAHLLAADPTKKRTTAIKEVGISDPSVVRRLRDKYQVHEATLLAQAHAATVKPSRKAAGVPAAAVATPVAAQSVNGHAATAKTAAAPVAKKGKSAPQAAAQATAPSAARVMEESITAAPQPTAHAKAAPQAAASAGTTNGQAIDPLAALFEGHNIETLVTQFIGHVLGLDANEIKNSPITALIKQQAQLADLVLPLLASQFLNQKSTAKAA